MKVTSTLHIGGASFEFEVDDPEEMVAMVNSITLASPRRTCNVCGTDGLDSKQLVAYRTKEGYRYVKVRCECGAQSNLGQYRDGDGFFWKEYETYTPEGDEQPAQQAPPAQQPTRNLTNEAMVNQAGLDAIEGKLSVLMLSDKALGDMLQERYGIRDIRQLTYAESREFYKVLAEKVEKELPF